MTNKRSNPCAHRTREDNKCIVIEADGSETHHYYDDLWPEPTTQKVEIDFPQYGENKMYQGCDPDRVEEDGFTSGGYNGGDVWKVSGWNNIHCIWNNPEMRHIIRGKGSKHAFKDQNYVFTSNDKVRGNRLWAHSIEELVDKIEELQKNA